jgi:hypothetical protein
MDPRALQEWEVILQSQVAVALLLLAALVAAVGILLTWIRFLYGKLEDLHQTFREHLESDLAVRRAVDEWAIRQMIHSTDHESDAPAA